MKKLKRFLLLLLIVPICFGFSACKKNKDKDNLDSNPPSTEQSPDTGNDNGGGGNAEPVVETYVVNFDYNLPEDYEFLLNDFTRIETTGTSLSLTNFVTGNLSNYFDGWKRNGSGEFLTEVSGSKDEVINLKGNWNEENLRKYYYSDGIELDSDDTGSRTKVISYSGESKTVILPKYLKNGTSDYEVNEICDSVFENKNIEKIIINSTGVAVDDSAFKKTNLSSIDFSKVLDIGDNAFENTKLTSVNLKSGINSVGKSAFKDCILLNEINFNSNSLGVLDYTFSGCQSLSLISNTGNLTSIGTSAFSGCLSLTNTDFIGNNVTMIGENAFKDCSGLLNVNIPASVVNLYDTILNGCENIAELSIGNIYITSPNDTRFDNLINHLWGKVYNEKSGEDENRNIESVTKIVITGNSVTKLYKNYFYGFVNLATFEMSDSITEIEEDTFNSCVNLKTIDLSASIDVDKFSYLAFRGTKYLSELNEPLVLNNSVIVYAPKTLSEKYKNYIVESNITKITKSAFLGNETLETIKFHSNIELIAEKAFQECENLTSVEFETNTNITKINKRVFYRCTSLASINLGALTNLTIIDNEAFVSTNISKFTIPTTVTQINKNVFGNAKITEFVLSGTTSVKYKVVDGVLYDISGSTTKLLAYPAKKADDIFVCPDDVTEFMSYSFYGVENLYIFFRNLSIAWEETINAIGQTQYNVFNSNSLSFICLKDVSNFTYTEKSVDYYSYTDDAQYGYDNSSITLVNKDNLSEGLYFVGFTNEDNDNKISIAVFELEKVGSGDEETLQVKEGSLKTFNTNLNSLQPNS